MSAWAEAMQSRPGVETPDITANPRVVEVVQPLIDRVQEVIREKDVSYDEWRRAVQFMTDLAACGEVPLLMAYFEASVDEVANAAAASSTTAIEGPYYVPGSPMLEPP